MGRRKRIGARTMMIDQIDRVMFCHRLKLVINDVRQQLAGELNSTEARVCEPVFAEDPSDLVIHESHIKTRIVRYENGIADETKELVDDVLE